MIATLIIGGLIVLSALFVLALGLAKAAGRGEKRYER